MPVVSWDYEPQVRKFHRAVLSKGRELGITDIGPTKMLGLLYLLDVEYVTRYGAQATDVAWQWRDYGPFQADAAYGPRSDDLVEELAYSGPYEGSVYRLVNEETFLLEQKVQAVLDDVFERFGRMTGSQIKHYCYVRTEPMLKVLETGRRGDRLDMSVARDEGEVNREVAAWLMQIVNAVGSSRPTFDTHADDFVRTIDAGSALRERATEHFLRKS